MNAVKVLNTVARIAIPLLLGGAILFWMYRGFDFDAVRNVVLHEMNWCWMLLSFPFGILAQAMRGWRWRQTLDPLGEHVRTSVSVNAIFVSYAASLVIPRIGEFSRCGILKRYDRISFAKALGTVVTERAVDTLLLAIVTGITLVVQIRVFNVFFAQTGTSMESILKGFTWAGYLVTLVCAVAAVLLVHTLLKRLEFYHKIKATIGSLWQGIISLKGVVNMPVYVLLSVGIWVCYFLHYYLTFFCFDFTRELEWTCALVTFVVGSMAVIVPTPNGAGPWHFAVKTMLILYGVADEDALYFVLIVHSIQTLLVVALGIWGWMALAFTKRKQIT